MNAFAIFGFPQHVLAAFGVGLGAVGCDFGAWVYCLVQVWPCVLGPQRAGDLRTVVAVAFRSLLRMRSGSSGAYNLTVRSSRRRFMASCYLSASGCCRFGCTSLRRGLTQVLGLARNFLGMCGLCIELRLIGLLLGSSVPLRTWPTARRGPAHRGGGSIP